MKSNSNLITLQAARNYTITLIRHGETYLNSKNAFVGITDDPLNSRGREQASILAEYIRDNDFHFDLALSSPLQRAFDTARAIGDEIGLDIIKEPLLKERNYGVLEGLAKSDIKEIFPKIYANYQENKAYYQMPQGESAFEVEARILYLFTRKIPEVYPEATNILAVAHLNPIRAFLRILGLKDWDVYYQSFKNTSITQVETNFKETQLNIEDFSCVSDSACHNKFK